MPKGEERRVGVELIKHLLEEIDFKITQVLGLMAKEDTIRELIDALREEHGGEALASQLEELANRVELVQRKLGMMEARLASLEKAVEEGASRELKELLVKLASLMEELREAVAELRAVALIAE
ncbi:MAG: hypothetical protein DRN96_01835 [Thermoproteota archaeon]|nr:MAG: hypothetical protein DRN96_01835 [Candidatus Korarchaeota archaeon]RLG55470.1 MAG: hypothetical protein DRN99_02525 [Candidatus Korarchaeota archaeon]